jgi:hypothetical protein
MFAIKLLSHPKKYVIIYKLLQLFPLKKKKLQKCFLFH